MNENYSKMINDKILEIYQTIKHCYYKQTCSVLMMRIELARLIINIMFLNKTKYESKINEFHKTISKTYNFILSVEIFIMNICKINLVKYNLNTIVVEFDDIVLNLEKKVFENVNLYVQANDQIMYENEFKELSKFIENCYGNADEYLKLKMAFEEINVINKNRDSELVRSINPKYIKFNVIEGNKLQRPLSFNKEEFSFGRKLKFIIWELLNVCPNILQFYGINFESLNAIVEKPELGDLETIYSTKNITWPTKVYFSLGICRGLIFLHDCNIFHRNIRCRNVAIDKHFTPKLCNFDNAEDLFVKGKKEKSIMTNWYSPEILKNGEKAFNRSSEVFSFGMTLWELKYEKIPYENFDISEIIEHVVTNKKRESINTLNTRGNEYNQFTKTILSAWRDDPLLRPSMQKIYANLFNTYEQLKNEKLDINDFKENQIEVQKNNYFDDFVFSSVMPIPIHEGIVSHKKKNYDIAMGCFNYHEELGSPLAKYWKGYYLFDGKACEKDKNKARQLFKEAADFGINEAQLRYAFTLLKDGKIDDDDLKDQFVKYIKLSAEGENITAWYNLGDMFLKGKFVEVNNELGLYYIKLAAYSQQPNALKFFKI